MGRVNHLPFPLDQSLVDALLDDVLENLPEFVFTQI
jgi:hypothetical protein